MHASVQSGINTFVCQNIGNFTQLEADGKIFFGQFHLQILTKSTCIDTCMQKQSKCNTVESSLVISQECLTKPKRIQRKKQYGRFPSL